MVIKELISVCLLLSCVYINAAVSGTGLAGWKNAFSVSDPVNLKAEDVGRRYIQAALSNRAGHSISKRQVKRSPVILVPGLGGSQLWAKLNKPKRKPHFFCSKSTQDYYSIWLSITQLIPKVIDCCIDNLQLHYNRTTRTTHNTPGVDIQALNFGHPKSVEWLDPAFDTINKDFRLKKRSTSPSARVPRTAISVFSRTEHLSASQLLGDVSQAVEWLRPEQKSSGADGLLKWGKVDFSKFIEPAIRFGLASDLAYYSDMVKELVANGYTRGEDLRAAPYDFRKAPNEMADFFNKTKQLIEDTYAKNGNSRVLMVAHSMGNPVMLYFYNHVVSRQWKDKHIRAHVALAAPWGGALKSLKLMVSGDSLGIKYINPTKIRTVQRSMTSTAWLMPSPALWNHREVLVSTPHRNYTAHDYRQLFLDLGYMDGYSMWQDTHGLNSGLKFPEVEVHCLYGKSVKTIGPLVYPEQTFPDKSPKVEMDDGDGTVNLRSLEAFLPWMQQRSFTVQRRAMDKVTHRGILKDPRVIRYVLNMALN